MAQQVVLHVGSMKSGTSYLQSLLFANQELLADRGVLVPGRRWRDQVAAVSDVLDRARVARAPEEGAWQRLVEGVLAWEGTALVSMEWLGVAGPRKVAEVVQSFPAGSVRVVVTARDLNRQIPAMWQESLKNGRTVPFERYVAAVRDQEGPGRAFWREQTVGAMCQRWADAVGVEHLRLVTVPRPGAPRDTLWRRFAEAVGVEADGTTEPETANPSLGAASVEVLRRVNELVEDLPYGDYAPVVKHRLAKGVLGARRQDEPALGLDVPDWLPERSERMVTRLRELGVPVIGDLEDLRPVAVPGVRPADVPAAQQLDAAVAGLEGLVRLLVRRQDT